MTSTYFHVDVETTGPAPSVADLLSIGISAFRPRPDEPHTWDIVDEFYDRISHGRDLLWDDETLVWWLEQNEIARAEAFEDRSLQRNPMFIVMCSIQDFCRDVEPDKDNRVFVANPAGFDFSWFNYYAWLHLGENPCGYRSLCLRSMGFGMQTKDWGQSRSDDEWAVMPDIPNHPLHDARAQGWSLCRMIKSRDRILSLAGVA